METVKRLAVSFRTLLVIVVVIAVGATTQILLDSVFGSNQNGDTADFAAGILGWIAGGLAGVLVYLVIRSWKKAR